MKQDQGALIEACRNGNQLAQMQVYAYCKAMFNVACRYLKSEEDAKDAMQEAFLKAFKRINTYEDMASFGAWLKRIVINQCLDVLKLRKLNFETRQIEQLECIDEPDWKVDCEITKRQLLEAVEQLNPKHKVVVKLYLLEGYDHQEIADILGIPIKTSRTYLRRGRISLKDLLKTTYNEIRY